jgi:hypothetical protein
MNCEKTEEKFADYLVGDLDERSLAEVQAHLAACPACRQELENLSAVWTKLGVLAQEKPSPDLRQRFYAMLEAYKEGAETKPDRVSPGKVFSRWLEQLMPRRPVYQLALSLILLAVGLGAGYFLKRAPVEIADEVTSLRQEVKSMRQMIALSLLKQPSPSDRLLGVSWTSRLEQPDDSTLQALLETLNHDRNVNVRLAAVDALYLFYDHPRVKDGLIDSLARQTAPLVQISLINLLVEIGERRAVEALEQLIQNRKLNPRVRERAELVLAKLNQDI